MHYAPYHLRAFAVTVLSSQYRVQNVNLSEKPSMTTLLNAVHPPTHYYIILMHFLRSTYCYLKESGLLVYCLSPPLEHKLPGSKNHGLSHSLLYHVA